MKIGSHRFTPKLWAVLLYITVLLCMLWLGNWQLQRAALKVALQEAQQGAEAAEAIPLTDITDIPSAARQYQRVSLRGQYEPLRQFLWDNRTHKGQAGFEVVSLVRLEAGALALVNRGWIAPGSSRIDLPDVQLPDAALAKTIQIEGYLSRPSKGFASGAAVTGGTQWPKLLQYLDFTAISEALGEPIIPALVQVQALGTDALTATVLTSRPEWLKANWQPAASGPAKHYSYAFQWFAMAFALTGIFLVVNTQKDKNFINSGN